MNFGADTDNTVLVEVTQGFFGNVRNVGGDDFRAKLGLTDFNHEINDVDGCQGVVFDQFAADDDSVFEVVAGPGHESYDQVLTKGEFAIGDRHAFYQDVALFDLVACLLYTS